MGVPLFASSLEPHHDLLVERIDAVVRSGRYVLGPEVEAFEREFASYLGVEHCIGVGNGTDALTIALRAAGVAPGDEVVLPSFTFYATAEAAVNAGAVPVFCDVDPRTGCLTADLVEQALSERTRAIVPVHLFGSVAPVDALRSFGVPVVEDAAQAAGAARDGRRAGAQGDVATFSFFPSKNLPCLGDGGAIATNDPEIAERARRLRFHGSTDKSTFELVGYNSRLDAVQAAALRVLLPELDGWNDARRAAAEWYDAHGLGDVPGLVPPQADPEVHHVYHLYVARHPRPDALIAALAAEGVEARRYYHVPVHRQPGMGGHGRTAGELPGTAELAATNVALPMGPNLREEQVEAVIAACHRV